MIIKTNAFSRLTLSNESVYFTTERSISYQPASKRLRLYLTRTNSISLNNFEATWVL